MTPSLPRLRFPVSAALCAWLLGSLLPALEGDDLRARNRDRRAGTCLKLLQEGSPTGKMAALRILRELEHDAGVLLAIPLLKDAEPGVAIAAAHYLGSRRATQACDNLVLLLSNPDLQVRRAALCALAELGNPEVFPTLETRAKGSARSQFLWPFLAQAIARTGHPEASDLLWWMVGKTRDKVDQLLVTGWLGTLESRKVFRMLKAQAGRADVGMTFNLTEAALTAVGRCNSREGVQFLFDIIKKGPKAVESPYRVAAAQALSLVRTPEFITWLGEQAMKDGNEENRMLLASLLGATGCREAIPALARLSQDSRARVRVAAILSLGKLRAVEQYDPIVTAMEEDDAPTLIAVAVALGHLADSRGVPILLELFKSRENRVRAAAARSLYALRVREAVEPFIDALDRTRDWVQLDILSYLRNMTGKDFGIRSEPWREWWEGEGEDFQLLYEEDLLDRAITTYYGIEVNSNHVVFCLDVSGSMQWEAEYEPDDIIETGKALDEDYPENKNRIGPTRLAVAQWQLIRTIRDLPVDVRFTILFYSDAPYLWKEELILANRKNKEEAIEAVRKARAYGGTNIYGTLTRCFELAGDGIWKHEASLEVDTVFLLSDGTPTVGEKTDPQVILDRVRRLNPKGRVRIHTVGVGACNVHFMEQLALQSGGRFVKR